MNLVVKRIVQDSADVFSIILEKPTDFKFYPAQFIDLQLLNLTTDNSRILSFSSSPTEDFLMVTLKPGITPYKKEIVKLKPGDTVSITHPSGTYTLDESSPAIMMAGGVGIAPYRSMIKYAVDQKLDLPMTLIYSNRDADFPFKTELDNWQKQLPNLTIHYIVSSRDGRLTKQKLTDLLKHRPTDKPVFYLAGSPSFVDDFNKILQEEGVDSVNIRLDSFDGY